MNGKTVAPGRITRNSSLTLDVSQLPGGSLGSGQWVDVQILVGVAQDLAGRFDFIVEALP